MSCPRRSCPRRRRARSKGSRRVRRAPACRPAVDIRPVWQDPPKPRDPRHPMGHGGPVWWADLTRYVVVANHLDLVHGGRSAAALFGRSALPLANRKKKKKPPPPPRGGARQRIEV